MTITTHAPVRSLPPRRHRETVVPATATEWRHGTVAWFNTEKGFGYLEPDDRTSPVFVDFRAIDTRGYKTLGPGQRGSGCDLGGIPGSHVSSRSVRACQHVRASP
jgi:CspA family cold shock protein